MIIDNLKWLMRPARSRDLIADLELRLLEDQREIEEDREEARERHIYEFTHDKESLARDLEEEFGIVYSP
jgi:hypothetical protein